MTPYATRRIPKEDLALFAQIKAAVTTMQDPDLGLNEDGQRITLSCHMLARAIAVVFGLRVCDGYFSNELYDHSWNLTPQNRIIDAYPIGTIGGPIMFDNGQFSPCHRLYKTRSTRTVSRRRFSKLSFRRSVCRISNFLRTTQL
jgi:hypothetical protein